MIAGLKKFLNEAQARKILVQFLAEMENNLETFYVMDQRQFITQGFLLDTWNKVKGLDMVKKHESVTVYARTLEEFNTLYKSYKEYEQWYTGDVARKNPDNARKLHSLKNDLDKKLKGMDAVIIPAGQALEKEMLQLGWLKA